MKKIISIIIIFSLFPLFAKSLIMTPTSTLNIIVNTQGQDASFVFSLQQISGSSVEDYGQVDIQTINHAGSGSVSLIFPDKNQYGVIVPILLGFQINMSCISDDPTFNSSSFLNRIVFFTVTGSNTTCNFRYISMNQRTPVLIIPGVTGTDLFQGSNLLWANEKMSILPDSFMDALAFDSELAPTDNNIFPGSVIRNKTFLGKILTDYTSGLIRDLISEGYIEGEDLFTFPYDWRYGVSGLDSDGKEVNIESLKGQIDYIVNQTGSTKVDVVAHSTGGLLVKKYVEEHPADHHIDKAVFVGVPNLGAPKAYKVLINGDNFDVPGLNPNEMKKLAQNMPVVYDLAPTQGYIAAAGSFLHKHNPFTGDASAIDQDLNYDPSVAEFNKLNLINDTALARSEELHTSDFDNLDIRADGVDLYNIVGCGTGTFGQFTETINKFSNPTFDFPKITSGDGTVPLGSANSMKTDEDHKFYAPKSSHGKLLSAEGVRQEIVNIISGSNLQIDSKKVSSSDSQCALKKGHWWQVFSPVNIEAIDQEGSRTGVLENGSIQNDIPGADLEIFGEHKYFYVPTDDGEVYTVKLTGTGEGNFTLKDSLIENDHIVSTQTFSNVPVTPSLAGTVQYSDEQTTLLIDGQVLVPGDYTQVSEDPTPAQISYSGDGSHPAAPDSLGQVLGATKIADGALVLDSTDGRTVYQIGTNGKKYGFVSADVFLGLGYNFGNLMTADLSKYETGELINSINRAHPDGTLVIEGQTIWFINNGKRNGIVDIDSFDSHGFQLKNIVLINSFDKDLEALIL
jgi:hypothetical protein